MYEWQTEGYDRISTGITWISSGGTRDHVAGKGNRFDEVEFFIL